MALTIVTPATTNPVTLAEAKTHLRISAANTAESALITTFISVATEYCQDLQNRAYITQVWNLRFDGWPVEDYITIPLPPLQSVSSVTYYGTGGTSNTMTAGNYIVDIYSEPGRLALAYGEAWPNLTLRPINGIAVKFTAGYGTAGTIPDRAKQAINLLVGHMFEHRENSEIKKLEVIPDGVFNLLAFQRIWPI